MTYNTIKFQVADGVAEITLNRPDAANAMDLQMMQELADVSIRCDETPEIRAVLITAAGKMFSAGGDIRYFGTQSENLGAAFKEMTVYFHAAISRFSRMNVPLIAAVQGMCAGGGLSLAAAADMTLASDNAAFTLAYTAAGLSPDGGSTYFLPRRIGDRRTRELMLTNRRLTAQEAFDWGLINAVHPAAELMGAARSLANTLASGPTLAFGQVKTLLNASFDNGLETQMEYEARGIAAMARTRDTREGLDAFLNKRKPVYTGQ